MSTPVWICNICKLIVYFFVFWTRSIFKIVAKKISFTNLKINLKCLILQGHKHSFNCSSRNCKGFNKIKTNQDKFVASVIQRSRNNNNFLLLRMTYISLRNLTVTRSIIYHLNLAKLLESSVILYQQQAYVIKINVPAFWGFQ
jgi:hypothetical protein